MLHDVLFQIKLFELLIHLISDLQLYKETLFDLLAGKSNREESVVDIREDARGGIKIVGVTEIPVTTMQETMKCLEQVR